jgi:hypothetical protein
MAGYAKKFSYTNIPDDDPHIGYVIASGRAPAKDGEPGKEWAVLSHNNILTRVNNTQHRCGQGFVAFDGNFRQLPHDWTLMRIGVADRAHRCHTLAWFVLQGQEDPTVITDALLGLDRYIAKVLNAKSLGGLFATTWVLDGSDNVRLGVNDWYEEVRKQTTVPVMGDRSRTRTHPSTKGELKLLMCIQHVRAACKEHADKLPKARSNGMSSIDLVTYEHQSPHTW